MRRIEMPQFTLGWELEANRKADITPKEVDVHSDGSVNGDAIEYVIKKEYISDIPKSLEVLQGLCRDSDIMVDKSCGFHVHIGLPSKSLRSSAWAGWYHTLARMLEKEAFSSVPESRRNNNYCRSLTQNNIPITARRYVANKYDNSDRYMWVNVVEMFRRTGIKTVEVRLLGNTHRYAYLLSWISVCREIAKSAWTLSHDASGLENELIKLRSRFQTIREVMLPVNSHGYNRLSIALEMAYEANLLTPPVVARPLASLRYSESAAIRERRDEEREEENRRLRDLRDSEYNRALEIITFEVAAKYVSSGVCLLEARQYSEGTVMREIACAQTSLIHRHGPAVYAGDSCTSEDCLICPHVAPVESIQSLWTETRPAMNTEITFNQVQNAVRRAGVVGINGTMYATSRALSVAEIETMTNANQGGI